MKIILPIVNAVYQFQHTFVNVFRTHFNHFYHK